MVGVVIVEEWSTKYENIRMELGEDPHTFDGGVDDIVDMLDSLEVHESDKEVNRKFIRYVKITRRRVQAMTLINVPSTMTQLELILCVSSGAKPGIAKQRRGGTVVLNFAAGPGRRGLPGGRRGHGSGQHQRRSQGNGRGRGQAHGNSGGGGGGYNQ